jgi:peroxisomal coenzyme A diphosphatase NUDT7
MNYKLIDTIKSNLPAYPTLIGRDRFFNSAVLVPLIWLSGEYHMLFQQRAASIRQGSEYCFPGGKFDSELDKNYQSTAIRETVEELGIDKDMIRIEGNIGTLLSPMGVAIEAFLATFNISGLHELCINNKEVKRIFTLPLAYLKTITPENYSAKVHARSSYTDSAGNEIILLPVKKLGLPDKYITPWGGNEHRILVYSTKEGVIWGITAEIINEILNKY